MTLTLLPLPNENGVLDITVTVSDGIVNVSESFTLTVMSVYDAPAISSISDQTMSEDTSKEITFTASDPDLAPCSLTLTITSSNPDLITDSGLSVVCMNNMYTLTADPKNNAFGSSMITIIASDGTTSAETHFTITVDNTPDPISLSLQNGNNTIDINTSYMDKLRVSQMDFVPITVCGINGVRVNYS